MNLPDSPAASMLRERMTWLNQRQDVLSQNVANADTPGYVARDLKPLDFDEGAERQRKFRRRTLMTTDPRHIALSPSHRANSKTRRRQTRKPIPTAMRFRWNRK